MGRALRRISALNQRRSDPVPPDSSGPLVPRGGRDRPTASSPDRCLGCADVTAVRKPIERSCMRHSIDERCLGSSDATSRDHRLLQPRQQRCGCYLLVQESKASAWSRFNLPAGKPEQGETLTEAAVREAQEETGLKVTVDHLVGIYQCPRTSEGFGVVNFVFFSEVVGGDLRTSNAHPVVRYFSTGEIAKMVSARRVRGRHIPAAIADHEAGRQLATSLIQVVSEVGRPDQAE